MKRKILLGICLSALVLVIAPAIPAQTYAQIKHAYETTIQEQFPDITTAQFTDLEQNNEPKQETLISIMTSLKETMDTNDESSFLTYGFIINTIISLFFSLIGTIFGMIFGPILAMVALILASPALLLSKIISLILGNEVILNN